jgi:hypothetical protein
MRIGAVIMIVGAHDARNAGSRPTVLVPDGRDAAGRSALTRPGAAAGHPGTEQQHGRRRRFSLRAPGGACHRASAKAAALGRGRRPLTPALLGTG